MDRRITLSGEDEYAPAAVKANYEALASRIAAAAGRGIESNRAVIIPGGGHSLRQPGARKAFIEHVESFFDEWLAFPGVGPAAEFAASSAAALRWGVERLEARMQSELRASELRAQEDRLAAVKQELRVRTCSIKHLQTLDNMTSSLASGYVLGQGPL